MLNQGLSLAIKNNSLSHAYIIYDEQQAFEFAKAINILPADFIIQEDLLTKAIEGLQASLKIKPFGDRRLVLIKNADNMQPVVQNKLLKTLEEPLGNTIIILSANRREAFLPTILSRCIEISSGDKALKFSDKAKDLAEQFFKADAKFFVRKALIENIEDKEFALEFLNALEDIQRAELIRRLDSSVLSRQINKVEETRKSIESGFSLAFALKSLALDM